MVQPPNWRSKARCDFVPDPLTSRHHVQPTRGKPHTWRPPRSQEGLLLARVVGRALERFRQDKLQAAHFGQWWRVFPAVGRGPRYQGIQLHI